MVINKTLDTTYTITMQLEDSVQFYHLYNITNNAVIGAPYNGTTGIEDHGVFVPDSICTGWSYLTLNFEPVSVSLFEVSPYLSIKEFFSRPRTNFLLPTIMRKGTSISIPFGTHVLYTVTGREIYKWRDTETIKIPHVPDGIYFINVKGRIFKKVIIF